MSTTFRNPTGKPGYPKILIAGVEKSGKSLEIARLSASGLVGAVYWIAFGERSADEYGQIPGSRFQIAEPTTRAELRTVIRAAVRLPRVDPALPNCIALDSATALWETLSAEAQDKANARAAKKAAGPRSDVDPVEDGDIHADLWNEAREHWYEVLSPLLAYRDLVVITARLDEVTVMRNGQPTKAKQWKAAGHKRLPGDVDAILQFRSPYPGPRFVTGLRSLVYPQPDGTVDAKPRDYAVADLLHDMGISEATVDARSAPVTPRTEAQAARMPEDWEHDLADADRTDDRDAALRLYQLAERVGDPAAAAAIRAVGTRIKDRLDAWAAGREPAEVTVKASVIAAGVVEPAPLSAPHAQPDAAPELPQTVEQLHENVRDEVGRWWAENAEHPAEPDAQAQARADTAARATWRSQFDAAVRESSVRRLEVLATRARSSDWPDLEEEANRERAGIATIVRELDAAKRASN